MAIFRKNKRQFAYRSHRMVFVAMFLFVFGFTAAISLLQIVRAENGPVASVRFESEHSNYDNVDSGAWKITKSAEWTSFGKARITFEVVSRSVAEEPKPKDVVMVFDKSGSMEGAKIARVKSDASELANHLLEEPNDDNQIALIGFDEGATIMTTFTKNKQTILGQINSLYADGGTYYDSALSAVNSLLSDYSGSDERSLIILFLTDGLPNGGHSGLSEYLMLKTLFPNSIIHGIQYEMGDTILSPIVKISDQQHIANMNTLNNVLFSAVYSTKLFSTFTVTDYINDTYWTVNDDDSIHSDFGTTSLTYDGSTPKIVWDMNNKYRSGSVVKMTIDIELKSEFIDDIDQLLPTNKRTAIISAIEGAENENLDENNLTPILKDAYMVRYYANAPSGCAVSGIIPDASKHSVYSSVENEASELSCPGYTFLGWEYDADGITMINDDYFIMPANDVNIIATWGYPTISKSLDGQMNVRAEATFAPGPTVNEKIRILSGETDFDMESFPEQCNTAIKGFVRTEILSNAVNINDDKNVLSADDSPVKIYGWFDAGTGNIYYYSDADDLYLNQDASKMFFAIDGLANINSLADVHVERTTDLSSMFETNHIGLTNTDAFRNWDVSNVTNMNSMFGGYYASAITDFSGVADWDVSNVTDFTWFCNGHSITDLTAFSKWDTSSATSMRGMFWGLPELTSLEGIEGFKTGNVTNMGAMFYNSADKLHDVDELENWDVSNVENLSYMFYSDNGFTKVDNLDYGIFNVNGLRKWDVKKVTDMHSMFWGMNNLSDISGLSSWKTNSLLYPAQMFEVNSFTNINALANWDFSKAIDMRYMFLDVETLTDISAAANWDISSSENIGGIFASCISLSDISPIAGWDTSNVKYMYYAFSRTTSLTDISPLSDWDVKKVEDMSYMFQYSVITDVDALANWKTNSLVDVSHMFQYAEQLTNIGYLDTDAETGETTVEGGLSHWNMSNVTTMFAMFSYATKLQNVVGATNWDTSNVTTMSSMFNDTYQLIDVEPLAGWDVKKVEDMGWMFDTSSKITSLSPLSGWQTLSLKTTSNMFSGMSKLASLDGLQNWDVSHVTDMYCMFDWTSSLSNVDELSNWDVSNVTKMSNMFRGSKIMNVNGLANWHPYNVTNFAYVFSNTSRLTDISGLSGWFDTDEHSKVTVMESLFDGAVVTNLDALANWKTPNLTNLKNAFSNNTNLTNVDGLEHWNTSKLKYVDGIFSGDTSITAADAFSKLNNWDTTKLTNMTDAFKDVPDSAIRPTWYSEPDSGN